MNHIRKPAPVRDWRQRPFTRGLVFVLAWLHGNSYAVEFPSLPLQTGAVQPAPNIVFILDDSTSMTVNGGDALDTGLNFCGGSCPNSPSGSDFDDSGAGAPYTKNPLSYNPGTTYQAWATANTTNTNVERLSNASYTAAYNSIQLVTGTTTNLGSSTQTYYVPKPSATLTDKRQYYRYQILSGGNRLVRAEWVSTAAPTVVQTLNLASTWSNITGGEGYWGNVGNPTSSGNGTCADSDSNFRYQVPSDGSVTRVVISTTGATGTNDNPDLYVRSGSNPCTGTYLQAATSSNVSDTITIDNPPAGYLYIGVRNAASGTGDRTFSNLTLTVEYSTVPTQSGMGCSTSGSGTYGWKNCTDVSGGDATTGVRALAAEKQNFANWYQYHRSRMKAAKAGSSEAFATLDENYRVGIMGLYPNGTYQQVINGSTGGDPPTASDPGNLSNLIPVDTNSGLFVGNNRKNWFDYLHEMEGVRYTPLRQALDAAGRYFTTSRAYRATDNSGNISYLACRQNFAILTTDGYWNNIGSEDPDSDYSGLSGDEENGSVITGPNNQSFQYLPSVPYRYANLGDYNDGTTLADIAMHYWKTDLRTSDVTGYAGSSENRVPFSTANPAFWQHMVTFGVGLGVRGELTDTQVAHAMAGTGTAGNGGFWPAPVHQTTLGVEDPENVDDLRHAAVNARGSYINANDAEEFSSGITDALSRIGERRGSASNVLANSTSISTDSFVFQATYTSGAWRGELLAYPISNAGLGAPQWRAGERVAAWGSRNIFTVAASGGGGSTFPNSAQATTLNGVLGLGVNGTQLAQYLKGDATQEERNGGPLRDREMFRAADQVKIPAPLGDIVNSSPFYVADVQTLFVGANDGMLHAIDASNTTANVNNTAGGGTERFAYIPRGVAMSQLAELADPLYGTNTTTKPHRYFVDGPIVVSARARTPGKNYLVGALGRGGRGVYGLDVTNPAAFAATDVLWDLTGSSAPDDMGNVIAEPLISKLNNGVTAAVVANGPNSLNGTANLFIIDLADGSIIKRIQAGVETNNGLSAPRAVDANADGLVDYFFAGDLLGNLWRFDVSATSTLSWDSEKVFTARDASNNVQPITSGPGVARDPATGKIWVFFGTGSYMTTADQTNLATQTYYGVIVGNSAADGTNLTRNDLQERNIYLVDSATGRRAFELNQASVAAGELGWFIDLDSPANTGERVVSAPIIFDNILVFSSIVPPGAATVNSCDAGGTGYVNALNAFSGTSLAVPFFDYSPDTLTDEDGNEVPIGSLPITSGMPTAPIIIGDKLVIGDSSGGTPTDIDVSPPGGSSTRRISWRELPNDE